MVKGVSHSSGKVTRALELSILLLHKPTQFSLRVFGFTRMHDILEGDYYALECLLSWIIFAICNVAAIYFISRFVMKIAFF